MLSRKDMGVMQWGSSSCIPAALGPHWLAGLIDDRHGSKALFYSLHLWMLRVALLQARGLAMAQVTGSPPTW
jgi:hypothetical protein